MKKFYFYRRTILSSLMSFLFGKEGIYIWRIESQLKYNKIKFPEASQYVDLMNDSRRILAECFNQPEAEYLVTYFKKVYDLKFHDYYTFRKSIPVARDKKEILILGDSVMDAIFQKRHVSERPRFAGLLNLGLHLIWLIIYFTKFLLLSVAFGGRRVESGVVYLRKKPYPDLGMMERVRDALDARSVEVTPLFTLFGKPDETQQFHYLNELRGSIKRLLLCLFEIFKLLRIHSRFFLPTSFMRERYQRFFP